MTRIKQISAGLPEWPWRDKLKVSDRSLASIMLGPRVDDAADASSPASLHHREIICRLANRTQQFDVVRDLIVCEGLLCTALDRICKMLQGWHGRRRSWNTTL